MIIPCNESVASENIHVEKEPLEFFYVVKTEIHSVLQPSFLDKYVRAPGSQFYALTSNAPIDQTSTLSICSGWFENSRRCFANKAIGKLVMSVDGETYSQLGLQGTKEKFGSEKDKKRIYRQKFSRSPHKDRYGRIHYVYRNRY